MVAGAALPEDLADPEWLLALEDIAEEIGYFSRLDDAHAAIFADNASDVLFVAFETLPALRMHSESGLPFAFEVAEPRRWSHLTLLAHHDTWFRADEVFAYFDRMVDSGFFDEFTHVVFHGAGPNGYAALAYSVAAPGATVIAVSPQATLDRGITEWDDRFPSTRRTDFRNRYGYAPDMVEAAKAAILIYDPDEQEDAMHATLFRAPNVMRLRYRRGRAGAIEADLREMEVIPKLAGMAVDEQLSRASAAVTLRARHEHEPWLRAMLARTLAEDRPWLTATLCRAVLSKMPLPRFRRHLELAEEQLAEARRG